MKVERSVRSTIAVVFCLMMLMGCASFPGNQLTPVDSMVRSPEGEKKANVVYSFTSGVDLFGKQEHPENVRAQLETEFADVLRESGYFASVSPGKEGEMRIQVRLVNSGNPAAMIPAFFTGLSLYTIPSWATDQYDITAKVFPPDGKEHTYELADSMTTVQWLPMIVLAPSKNMMNVSKEVRRNIWKHLILKMQQDGLLQKSVSPGPTTRLDLQFGWKASA